MTDPVPDPPAAEAVPVPAAGTAPQPRALSLQFTGSASEYFRIWIVNLCLTVFTLGVFSAWAKVRKKRYLYSHTLLDGTPFQYLGQPIPILKGRLVAALLFATWYAATHFVPWLLLGLVPIALAFAPVVVTSSTAFNARSSAFRNMTFRFSGKADDTAFVMYGWGLLAVLTAGLCYPLWKQRMKRYLVTHLGFGGVLARFSARAGSYFGTYLVAGLALGAVLFVVGLAVGLAMRAFLGGGALQGWPAAAMQLALYAPVAAAWVFVRAHLLNLEWNQTRLGPLSFRSRLEGGGLLWIYAGNAAAILASAGLLVPWATLRVLRYRIGRFSVTLEGELAAFQGDDRSTVQAAGAEIADLFGLEMSL